MSRKNRGRSKLSHGTESSNFFSAWFQDLHPETKHSSLAVISFMCAALLALSFTGKGGVVGASVYRGLDYLLGRGYFFGPLAFILVGSSLLTVQRGRVVISSVLGGALFLLSSLAIVDVVFGTRVGGVLGFITGGMLLRFFDFWGGLVIAAGFFLISLLVMLNLQPRRLFGKSDEGAVRHEEAVVRGKTEAETEISGKAVVDEVKSLLKNAFEKKEEPLLPPAAIQEAAAALASTSANSNGEFQVKKLVKKFDYAKPPLELLQGDRGTPSSGDIRANSNIIKRTLENFGIEVEMGEVSVGPTVTQYTLKPAEGIKLARITALHNDLSLALAAHPIRIEAPIPGKSLVGIEVPNKSISLVGLRALLELRIFQESVNPLLFVLGRDVAGNPTFADLARMPHLLISGATGSGKSVSVHSIVTSLIYRNPPELLRFIIVDPKRVELSVYNDIPHLLTPVITDPKRTVQALRWATREMDRRYDLLSEYHARDIAGFNALIGKRGEEMMPYIVIIIDELADLMATFPREVESSIIRLAQMARAVGIHLIVATQRPSVEVITGLIKANITSRIAFQVASQVDSRTVLDMAGAEKLLGNGDMLFLAGDTSKPRRIQGAFVSEQEVKRVVDFLREEAEAPVYEEGMFETGVEDDKGGDGDFAGGDDLLYDEAKGLVEQAGKASASYLQRRLRVGYARAARLLDIMEAKGVVGPADGAKPREVFSQAGVREEDENLV